MKKLLSFFLMVLSFSCFAQQELQFIASGKVTDSATGLPLAGASVFCQNTTRGTTSNNEGQFQLYLPNGGYDLVISFTGYETHVMRINNTMAANLSIALKQKDKSLQEVAVIASNEVPDGWAKYGQFFIDNFIGTTANAGKCKIQNPETLQFYFSKKRNRLKVKAKEDLIIVNNSLGYKIKFQLDSFAYEYNTNISVYTGFPFFEELTGSPEDQKIWKENREKAYRGSRLHFIRSWHDSTLLKEGFAIEKVDSNSTALKTFPVDNPYDSSIYKGIDNKDVDIGYTGKLRIIYKNAPPDPKYLAENKLPSYLKSQISILDITDGFTIEQNGYFYDQNDITNIGYWTRQKLADSLPYDYKPG